MSEIKTKIRTYNDVIDLFGEEKAAAMPRNTTWLLALSCRPARSTCRSRKS